MKVERRKKIRLGELLIEQKVINEDQLNKALAEQKRTGRKLGRVLTDLGIVDEQHLNDALARHLQIPFVDLKQMSLDQAVVRLLPDTLVIAVKERRQLAVWQHNGKSVVIDDQGQVIREANPARFATLPLVVGAGGAQHAGEILPTLAQRPKLMARLEALVRVDDRRWDLRLKDGALIQLPAVEEEQALIQLEQLDLRSRILELGFERIDLRNPDVVAVRPRAPAPPQDPTAPAPPPAEGA